MQKPICVKCACYFRPEKNGITYLEQKPIGGKTVPRGYAAPDLWEPYKLWRGDLWECPECHHQIIHGTGFNPIRHDYEVDFGIVLKASTILVKVNDC